jgi:hypothetical protein
MSAGQPMEEPSVPWITTDAEGRPCASDQTSTHPIVPRPGSWRALVTLTALALVLAAASPAGARPTLSATAMPVEGVFENCPLETAFPACVNRLAVMRNGGVKVAVISAFGTSLEALSRYAAVAHRVGMSVMWEIGDSNWWQQPPTSDQLGTDHPQFAAACGCTQNRALHTYLVAWLAALPGTYGYYAADDTALRPGDGSAIASYMARIKQLDPNHPAMIGAYSEQQRSGYQSKADLIGQEIYPVTTDPILPRENHRGSWGRVSQIATATQASADRAGTASAFILQAFSWGDNLTDGQAVGVCSASDTIDSCNARLRYPTGAEQLALRDAILRGARPALILWYSFPGTYGSAAPDLISRYPSGAEAGARWAGLSAAIRARFAGSGHGTPARQSRKRRHSRRSRRPPAWHVGQRPV